MINYFYYYYYIKINKHLTFKFYTIGPNIRQATNVQSNTHELEIQCHDHFIQ